MAEIEVQKTPDQEALEKIIEIRRASREQIKKIRRDLKQQKKAEKSKGKPRRIPRSGRPHRRLC